MNLSDKFYEIIAGNEEDAGVRKAAADLVSAAPEGPERDGLLGLLLHEGIGVPVDLDKSFDHAEKAAKGETHSGIFFSALCARMLRLPIRLRVGLVKNTITMMPSDFMRNAQK